MITTPIASIIQMLIFILSVIVLSNMILDFRDGVTIAVASFGFLLGTLVGFALQSNNVVFWQISGTVLGAAFAAYFLSE
ncbi:hypothetical protein [Haladaptatus sp. CMAA 1909]|uniref:hypothetical protein n=1 Tax=Haladaptatus sp. CMAA 1909 TaxID=3368986 RepID=UPI00375454E9